MYFIFLDIIRRTVPFCVGFLILGLAFEDRNPIRVGKLEMVQNAVVSYEILGLLGAITSMLLGETLRVVISVQAGTKPILQEHPIILKGILTLALGYLLGVIVLVFMALFGMMQLRLTFAPLISIAPIPLEVMMVVFYFSLTWVLACVICWGYCITMWP